MVATGCDVQIDPQEYQNMNEVDVILGNSAKLSETTWKKIFNSKDKKQKLLEICSTIDFKNYDTGDKNELGVKADNLYTDYNTNNDHIYRNQVVHILNVHYFYFHL